MDLDSLKEKSKHRTAPPFGTLRAPSGTHSVDDLISRLKEADEGERRKLRKALPFFIIAAACFTLAFVAVVVLGGRPATFPTLLLRGMLMVLYAALTVTLVVKLRGIARIDYGEPVRHFLAKAERRYAFGTTAHFLLAYGLTLFLSYGAFFYISDVLRRYFDVFDARIGLSVTVLFFSFVYGFGLWATRKNWKKEKEEIWLQTKRMKDELEQEETTEKP